jgi:hypothetical protein
MTGYFRQAGSILFLLGSIGFAAAQAVSNPQPAPDASAPVSEPIGATVQTTPAKFSEENNAKDQTPLGVNDLRLSDADKQGILQAIAQERAPVSTTGAAPSGNAVTPPEPGALLSDAFEMRDFPAQLSEQMPALKNNKYVALPERVLIVNPTNRVVLTEIKK